MGADARSRVGLWSIGAGGQIGDGRGRFADEMRMDRVVGVKSSQG